MKIFCFTCREYVLNTTEHFILGVEYNGSMFAPAGRGGIWGNMFRQNANVKRGNLYCPRCEGLFIRHGKLLTENGVVHPGQKSIDTSFTIVAGPDHPLPGRLMGVEDSRLGVDRVADAAKKRQELIDSYTDVYEDLRKDLWDEVPYGVKSASAVISINDPGMHSGKTNKASQVSCPSCGKTYKNTEAGLRWYDKHVENCR